ncbi:MAG: DUF1214 domain-containing protein, partial [bacterium]
WPGAVRRAGYRDVRDDAAIMSTAAWEEFLEKLRQAGEFICGEKMPTTLIDRAEGYRHLAALLSTGASEMLSASDPERPRFGWADSIAKWGLDCADALYCQAPLRPGALYRVRGYRGSVHFLGFQLTAGARALADLDGDDLVVGPQGEFELIIGGEPRDGNWMELAEGGNTLTVRQFFYDWDNEIPASLVIDRIDDGERRPPQLVGPGGIIGQLPALGAFVCGGTEFWADSSVAKRDEHLNSFPEDHGIGSAAGSSQKFQAFGIGYFKLAPDEALIVEVTPPTAKYWSLHLGNFWGESMDYTNFQSSLNGHQAVLDADGVFRAVISERDPGIANWLDTAGHSEGSMVYRWNQADGAPIPDTRVVKLDEVKRVLPDATPRVDPSERLAAVERRREHMRRRHTRVVQPAANGGI